MTTGQPVYRAILVGTDGSVTAGRAVERAVRLASEVGARLIAAHVGDPTTGRTVLDNVVAQHGGSGAEIEPRLLTGDPADALLDVAAGDDVELIIVGNKGMTGAQRFLLGSVPNKVSHKAPCDVLIVHTTGDR